jgi:hypothetical protein
MECARVGVAYPVLSTPEYWLAWTRSIPVYVNMLYAAVNKVLVRSTVHLTLPRLDRRSRLWDAQHDHYSLINESTVVYN